MNGTHAEPRRSVAIAPLDKFQSEPEIDESRSDPDSGSVESSPFRRLIGEHAWRELPEPVQRRFERHLEPGESAIFVGEVAETRLTPFGRLTAQLARLVGSPLPLKSLQRTPAAVLVTEDRVDHSQLW